VIIGGARWLLSKAFKRLKAEEEDPNRRAHVDSADWAAFRALKVLDLARIGRVEADWDFLAALQASDEPGPEVVKFGDPPVTTLEKGPETLAETTELVTELTTSLFLLWDAATGAPWASPQFHRLCEDLRQRLERIRAQLARPEELDPAYIADKTRTAGQVVAELSGLLGEEVEPH